MKGLIIDEPHISRILDGGKDWEIRNKPFPYRIPEVIGLLTKKDHVHPHSILGYAEAVACHSKPPHMMLIFDHRHLASDFIRGYPKYMNAKTLYAYEIGDAWRFPNPNPYKYQRGQVVWVDV